MAAATRGIEATDPARREWLLPAAVALVAAEVLNIVGVFTEDRIHWINLFAALAVAVAAAAVVFGIVVRRALRAPVRAGATGLVCGIVGVLSVAVFWSGLPPILGLAAVVLGWAARSAGAVRRPRIFATHAIAAGLLALALDVVVYAADVASQG